MMKSSAVYSTSSASLANVVRRLSFASDGSDGAQLLDLLAHHRPALRLVAEQRVQLAAALARAGELFLDDEDFEPRQAVDLQFEDRVGLLRVEIEALHDRLRRVRLAFRLADDAQDFVERVEDLGEAFEQMDAAFQRAELVFQPLGDDVEPEVQEVPQHFLQLEAFGLADLGILGRDEAGEVHPERDLQRRMLEQIRHHHLLVRVLLQLELDPHVIGRYVSHVEQRRQLAAQDDVGDALDELRLVDRVGNAGDVDDLRAARGRPRFPRPAQTDAARAGPVDVLQLVGRVEDLAAGGEVRSFHPAAQLRAGQLFVLTELDQRRADLAEIVRRDVGRHADRDAGGPVDQQIRNARGQDHRLGLGAVVVRAERDRVLIDLDQHLIAEPREPAFRVAHRRGVVAVERSEVARAVDQRIAQRERLRHAHERLVERGVAVRVIRAHHVANHLRALAVLGVGGQVLLPHRVEDAALHRLEAVAHVGQRARRDDRQRVVQIARLRRFVERYGIAAAGAAATAAAGVATAPAATAAVTAGRLRWRGGAVRVSPPLLSSSGRSKSDGSEVGSFRFDTAAV